MIIKYYESYCTGKEVSDPIKCRGQVRETDRGHITPAHVADITEFEKLITSSDLPKEALVLADKGYCPDKNRRLLHDNEFLDGIMHKAARNRLLTLSRHFH